jgi:hypothetical protein
MEGLLATRSSPCGGEKGMERVRGAPEIMPPVIPRPPAGDVDGDKLIAFAAAMVGPLSALPETFGLG